MVEAYGMTNSPLLRPVAEKGLAYLVGARNGCGVSTLGENQDLTPRYGTACDPEQPWW